ncbi:DUF3913 family protein [Ectobacillus antri]|uniref:DUF3913 family protein n=1 Tax=Ectobacillus antri TaxID=2486280 RepID=A0ABT6H4K8_9BACI|nr:DUF3913 family protein [Ectobacillus antri]MDG4658389.1 DUF3913 family protein [Ectobacillus antri]MDG5753723.1 DUF3913 family protein [Ectobacillus antri]
MKLWFYEKDNQNIDLLGIWENVPVIPRIGEKVEIVNTTRTVADIKYVKKGGNFKVEVIITA